MRRLRACLKRGLLCLATSTPAAAHHFFAPEYERDTRGTIVGEVVAVAYANPHVSLEIAVETGNGQSERWFANTVGMRSLPGRGWEPDTIKAGERVVVEGFLGRDGSHRLWIQSIELPSGRFIYPVGREQETKR